MVKVKVTYPIKGLDRPLGLQQVAAATIPRQSAYEGGKVVITIYRPPLPPMVYPWYSFLLEADSTAGP
jgi:hypothetical protein